MTPIWSLTFIADNQALPHIYTGTALWPEVADIAAETTPARSFWPRSGGNPLTRR